MVKLTAPLHSQAASGSLAEALTFSSWKGRAYAKQKGLPADPKSGGQVSFRTMFKFLTTQWDLLSTANQATWDQLAIPQHIAPYNAYVQHNLDRWYNFNAPSKVYPATAVAWESETLFTVATWIQNRIRLTTTMLNANDGWGITFFASTTNGFTPGVDNAILAIQDPLAAPAYTFWVPPERTTWYFNRREFSIDGKQGTLTAQVTAVPP